MICLARCWWYSRVQALLAACSACWGTSLQRMGIQAGAPVTILENTKHANGEVITNNPNAHFKKLYILHDLAALVSVRAVHPLRLCLRMPSQEPVTRRITCASPILADLASAPAHARFHAW